MIIDKNDEMRRSRIWRITVLVSSVLIVLIAIFLLMKLFTDNPLEGRWESEDGNLAINIGSDGDMTVHIFDVAEGTDVDVKVGYTLDKDEKTITIREDAAELDKLAADSGGAYTREILESALANVATTFDYSVEGRQLTLTEREYGEQLTFLKK